MSVRVLRAFLNRGHALAVWEAPPATSRDCVEPGPWAASPVCSGEVPSVSLLGWGLREPWARAFCLQRPWGAHWARSRSTPSLTQVRFVCRTRRGGSWFSFPALQSCPPPTRRSSAHSGVRHHARWGPLAGGAGLILAKREHLHRSGVHAAPAARLCRKSVAFPATRVPRLCHVERKSVPLELVVTRCLVQGQTQGQFPLHRPHHKDHVCRLGSLCPRHSSEGPTQGHSLPGGGWAPYRMFH